MSRAASTISSVFVSMALVGMTLLGSRAWADATLATVAYQITVAPKATAYTGETFARRFEMTQTIQVSAPVTTQANVREQVLCEAGDYGPENCRDMCVAEATFQVATLTLMVTDLDSGRLSTSQPFALMGTATGMLEGRCDGRVPSIDEGRFQILDAPWMSAKVGPGQKQTAYLSLVSNLHGEIKAMGNDSYEFTGLDLPSELKFMYNYHESESWGVNGGVAGSRVRVNEAR